MRIRFITHAVGRYSFGIRNVYYTQLCLSQSIIISIRNIFRSGIIIGITKTDNDSALFELTANNAIAAVKITRHNMSITRCLLNNSFNPCILTSHINFNYYNTFLCLGIPFRHFPTCFPQINKNRSTRKTAVIILSS